MEDWDELYRVSLIKVTIYVPLVDNGMMEVIEVGDRLVFGGIGLCARYIRSLVVMKSGDNSC